MNVSCCLRWLLLVLALLPTLGRAQQPATAAFTARRLALDQQGMNLLAAWGIGNTAGGAIVAFTTDGRAKYAGQMSAGWGLVNLGLALAAKHGARASSTEPLRAEVVRAQVRTENLYLFNAGLDVAYVTAGFYLHERARRYSPGTRTRDQLRGYGQALWLQGGVLLAFDGALYAAHHAHGRAGLYPLLSRVQVGAGTVGVVLPVR